MDIGVRRSLTDRLNDLVKSVPGVMPWPFGPTTLAAVMVPLIVPDVVSGQSALPGRWQEREQLWSGITTP